MQQLQLTDFEKIKPYLDAANYEGYNSNFVTMMMWNHEYHVEYEIHDHFLVMVHNYKGTRYFAMPYCSKEYLKEAMDYMMEYARKEKFPFMIEFAVKSFIEDVKEIYGNQFIFERERDQDDYVYEKDMLMNLSGKKMQKRRNHYNNFVKEYPQHEYRSLDINRDFDTILSCLERWEGNKEASESLASEVYGILFLLSSNYLLDIKLGGIYINDELKAFIIASPLNHSTIQIHVEKADKDIRGLYPAIQKEFLEHEFPDFQYVNREEDMGLEGLRKSKLQLHPCHMVEKCRVFINDSYIRQACRQDKEDIKKLWLSRFEDEDEKTARFYFDKLYHEQYTYVTRFDHHVICALQIHPFQVSGYEHSSFILGVSTDIKYEHQGIMKKLMRYVLERYKGQRIYLQAYHPEIYIPFGFQPSHKHQVIKVNKHFYKDDTSSIFISNNNYDYQAMYNQYTQRFQEYLIRDKSYYCYINERNQAFGDKIMTFINNGQPVGYMIAHEDEEELRISEFIYNQELLKDIVVALCQKYDKRIIIETDMQAKIEEKVQEVITMMCNQPSSSNEEIRFINEIY